MAKLFNHMTLFSFFFKVTPLPCTFKYPGVMWRTWPQGTIIYDQLYEEIKAVTRENVVQKLPNWLLKFT